MRRVKARVLLHANGKVGEAYTKDRLVKVNEDDAYDREVNGFIEVPLKKGRSRSKGNDLERVVAKTFSKWLYGREDVLRRTPLSGGFSGVDLGDVFTDPAMIKELGINQPKLYVECKSYADLLQHSFFRWQCSGDAGLIGGWIADTAMKAKGTFWFLVLKGNGTDPWLLTPLVAVKPFEPIIIYHKQQPYCMAPLVSLESAYGPYKKAITG